jgi:hypothetical protein
MKFYRGLVDVGKAPVRNQVKRGFRPTAPTRDGRQVEVPKSKPVNPMSAAEVVVLRTLFGTDAITEMKEIGEQKNLSFAVERDRLEERYGKKLIERLFGAPGVRTALPREIEIGEAFMAIEDRVLLAQPPEIEFTDDADEDLERDPAPEDQEQAAA